MLGVKVDNTQLTTQICEFRESSVNVRAFPRQQSHIKVGNLIKNTICGIQFIQHCALCLSILNKLCLPGTSTENPP